jgi:hypothetical protein
VVESESILGLFPREEVMGENGTKGFFQTINIGCTDRLGEET